MQRSNRLAMLAVITVAAALSFSTAWAGRIELQAGSKLWLDGKSTVHEYKSTAASLKVSFEQDQTKWPTDATGAEAIERFLRAKGITSMDVVVAVTGLHSGKAGLDKNMYKALLAEKHPEIRFRMVSYEIAEGARPGELAIDATGTLRVAGVERELKMPVTFVRESDTVHLRGSASLLMSTFGIKPPTMMMGTLRTADLVVVSFDLQLESKDAVIGAAGVK
ncbi:MAG: YceI family protein [Candidatus Eisenbacteria bacterium]|uniref:YceI family protein n=1 Tax=Eiseniibacteriota bacterium TaxID=2212470 RepID=A0A849SUZ1_UNCEI|nr:YceI family protein [Candidatus Eisenbacteria bacterium]